MLVYLMKMRPVQNRTCPSVVNGSNRKEGLFFLGLLKKTNNKVAGLDTDKRQQL